MRFRAQIFPAFVALAIFLPTVLAAQNSEEALVEEPRDSAIVGTIEQDKPIEDNALTDLSWLEPIGVFIGTYGLAVFLVVYYAVKLYPELRAERGEWIREITLLRQLVDPATRPLTKEQAKIVLQLASSAQGSVTRIVAREVMPSYDYIKRPGGGERSVHLFGEELEYDPEAKMESEKRREELQRILERIDRIVKQRYDTSKSRFEEMFRFLEDNASRFVYRLGLLKYAGVSLEAIWNKAYGASKRGLLEQRESALPVTSRREVSYAREFVERHPASGYFKIEELFSAIRYQSDEEDVRSFQDLFERSLEKFLDEAEASEEGRNLA